MPATRSEPARLHPRTRTTPRGRAARRDGQRENALSWRGLSSPGSNVGGDRTQHLVYVAGTERDDDVARLGQLGQLGGQLGAIADTTHGTMAVLGNSLGQALGIDARNGFLAGRVDIDDQHHVGLVESAGEVVPQALGAGVAV